MTRSAATAVPRQSFEAGLHAVAQRAHSMSAMTTHGARTPCRKHPRSDVDSGPAKSSLRGSFKAAQCAHQAALLDPLTAPYGDVACYHARGWLEVHEKAVVLPSIHFVPSPQSIVQLNDVMGVRRQNCVSQLNLHHYQPPPDPDPCSYKVRPDSTPDVCSILEHQRQR